MSGKYYCDKHKKLVGQVYRIGGMWQCKRCYKPK